MNYGEMTLEKIADDLAETVTDLFVNAGERRFKPLAETLSSLIIDPELRPGTTLVAMMNELLTHDSDLLAPRATELMSAATKEIVRQASGA